MPEYTVKKEDIMVMFRSLVSNATQAITQGTPQADRQVIGNSIPMDIL